MSTQISYTDAQANLDQLCDQVIATGEPIILTRIDGKNVALIAEAELESLLETLHLLRSPSNANRLFTALERAKTKTIQPQAVYELLQRLGLDEDDVVETKIATAS